MTDMMLEPRRDVEDLTHSKDEKVQI